MNSYFIQDNLPFIILFAAVFQLAILYLIINVATKANLRAKYEWAQLELLAKISRVQGVPQHEIDSVFKEIK